jgi:hypothetical protein
MHVSRVSTSVDQGSDTVELQHSRSPSVQPTNSLLRAAFRSQRRRPIVVMWKPSILLAAVLAIPTQALHFYLDGAVQKCFYEELPKDTLVVGTTYLRHTIPFRVIGTWSKNQS